MWAFSILPFKPFAYMLRMLGSYKDRKCSKRKRLIAIGEASLESLFLTEFIASFCHCYDIGFRLTNHCLIAVR
jgi:hypothetical protein